MAASLPECAGLGGRDKLIPVYFFAQSSGWQVDQIIQVEAPARLHLGFLDLQGDLGRRFGGVGVSLKEIRTCVECARASEFSAKGPDSERALEYARRLLNMMGREDAVSIEVRRAIPQHAGLGSGTQMALTVGTALNHLFKLGLTPYEIAEKLARGRRSGIGIGSFEQGGFLVDGGRGGDDRLPPIIARHLFPEHWRIVLLMARSDKEGLSGEAERRAFGSLPEFPASDAAHLCRLTLMRILPSLLESDLSGFAQGIGELQDKIGDYFAPAQGGRFSHLNIMHLLKQAKQLGFHGVGQSSWGPTGFILADSETQAHALVRKLQPVDSGLELQIVGASNHGHQLTVMAGTEAAESRCEKLGSQART